MFKVLSLGFDLQAELLARGLRVSKYWSWREELNLQPVVYKTKIGGLLGVRPPLGPGGNRQAVGQSGKTAYIERKDSAARHAPRDGS